MNLFLEYKSEVIVGSFILGSVIAVLFYRRSHSSRAWKAADLVSVLLGGIGALVALMAASYDDERDRINRQIDISYAITKSFEASANRFLLLHCDKDRQGPQYRPAVVVVCKKTIGVDNICQVKQRTAAVS